MDLGISEPLCIATQQAFPGLRLQLQRLKVKECCLSSDGTLQFSVGQHSAGH